MPWSGWGAERHSRAHGGVRSGVHRGGRHCCSACWELTAQRRRKTGKRKMESCWVSHVTMTMTKMMMMTQLVILMTKLRMRMRMMMITKVGFQFSEL